MDLDSFSIKSLINRPTEGKRAPSNTAVSAHSNHCHKMTPVLLGALLIVGAVHVVSADAGLRRARPPYSRLLNFAVRNASSPDLDEAYHGIMANYSVDLSRAAGQRGLVLAGHSRMRKVTHGVACAAMYQQELLRVHPSLRCSLCTRR